MARYEILLLDADNTLFDFTLAEATALRASLAQFGISPTDELVETYSAINDRMWKMLERKEIDKPRLHYRRFEEFVEHCSLSCDSHAIADTYRTLLGEQCILLPGAERLCHTLRKTHRLYIVTNGLSSVQRARFCRSPIIADISELFISEEIGYEKPAREFFDGVAARIPNFQREKVLVIGDSLSSDMRGGFLSGIDTCWVNPEGKENPYADLKITYTVRALEELYDIV